MNTRRKIVSALLFVFSFSFVVSLQAQEQIKLKKKDRKKDVELVTSEGSIVLRLYDSTPLHRDNFLRLVKSGYYDSVLFHRVIRNFMIQSGDPNSKRAVAGQRLGEGGPVYTIPAEFRPGLFHHRGVLAAARQSDEVNPQKSSSASQFYIVQGRTFTNPQLDSIERVRLKGYKIPEEHREIYRNIGGTPQLDQNYTVFGEVVKGIEVVDRIANTNTSKLEEDRDRPLQDIRIFNARLIHRKKKLHIM
ncbi:MAG: peptidylprolyl isomerase [Flavisolibacter sp.]